MADIESYERRLLGVSKNLVDEVLTLRMRPFRDGVHAFGRMVRDLARSLGKDAQLTISGEDTLVVVGAAHLVGKNGIIELLKSRGYRLEQM